MKTLLIAILLIAVAVAVFVAGWTLILLPPRRGRCCSPRRADSIPRFSSQGIPRGSGSGSFQTTQHCLYSTCNRKSSLYSSESPQLALPLLGRHVRHGRGLDHGALAGSAQRRRSAARALPACSRGTPGAGVANLGGSAYDSPNLRQLLEMCCTAGLTERPSETVGSLRLSPIRVEVGLSARQQVPAGARFLVAAAGTRPARR